MRGSRGENPPQSTSNERYFHIIFGREISRSSIKTTQSFCLARLTHYDMKESCSHTRTLSTLPENQRAQSYKKLAVETVGLAEQKAFPFEPFSILCQGFSSFFFYHISFFLPCCLILNDHCLHSLLLFPVFLIIFCQSILISFIFFNQTQ